ncbi:unnamed protein product, partial [Brassica rapa]
IWPITNHTNKNAFLETTFICLDIQKTFHRFLHTFSDAIPRSDLYNHNTDTKIIIGFRLDRSKLVRLTLWDKEAANFRELNRISTRKNQIVIITSIIQRLHERKLSLTTTLGSRFYFDNDIDIIQRFQKRNKLLS